MEHIETSLANKLVDIAVEQFKAGFEFKRGRMVEIRKNEEFYNLRKLKVPKGRFAVPLPVMSGFVDTLMSKIDEPPSSKFVHTDLADAKKMRLTSLAFEKDMAAIRGNYAQIDRWSKKLGCFSGRPIVKFFAESDPAYKANFEVTDYEDFITEPLGGGDLNKHLFKGQDGIFRVRKVLIEGAKSGFYQSGQVLKLIASVGSGEFKNVETFYRERIVRYRNMGLNLLNNTYVGQPIYKLVEWVLNYDGQDYYLLFNYKTGVWIRAHLLKDLFESGLSPWVSWATHEDPNIFWSKAPCDDMRPIADSVETLFNQELYNRRKGNAGQRAFDPSIYKTPSQLNWRPDGLVEGTPPAGRTLADGIYEFKTRELKGTIDLLHFLDIFGAQKTGITPGTPQVPEREQKVGIRFANIQEMADRLGLINKSYRKGQDEMALRYYWGAIEHLDEKTLIEMIGEEGYGWNAIKKQGTHKFDIQLVGGSAEIAANEAKAKKRETSLIMLSKDEELRASVNPQWRLKQTLIHGDWPEEEIRAALGKGDLADIEILGEAAKAVQDIIQGREPKRIVRGATTGFLQYILDFATDKIDFDPESQEPKDLKQKKIFAKLTKYIQRHMPIVQENMARKAMFFNIGKAEAGREATPEKPLLKATENIAIEEPIPGTPGYPIKKGVAATNILAGKTAPAI